jgi:hypothetical protein
MGAGRAAPVPVDVVNRSNRDTDQDFTPQLAPSTGETPGDEGREVGTQGTAATQH